MLKGDPITLAIGLDVKNMSDLYSLGFKISFEVKIKGYLDRVRKVPYEEKDYSYNFI